MSFGRRLRFARKEKRITLAELEERAGVTKVSLNRYEKHGYEPTLRVAIKLAAALGMSLDELAQDEIAEEKRETARETLKRVSRETDAEA